MRFFPSDKKVTNQILVRKNITSPSTALRFLTTKKLKYAMFFNEAGKVTQFFISCRMKCYRRFIKIKITLKFVNIVKMVPKWCGRHEIAR